MPSHAAGRVYPMASTFDGQDIGIRARRRIACRLLPFVFLLFVVAYIDRVNVSFASLRMSTDLGFSDRVYGLGVGIFYVSYVLLEIPGALIAEQWSPRKWLGRIMISWGAVTILTGFVNNTGQFYAVRFFLGAAEASFVPTMIVYLTRWFTLRDRSRAIACLFAAIPAASLVGSPLAGMLLGVHWQGLAGWRWLFVLEGVPAVLLGVVALFYLTDRPAEARWLAKNEQEWISKQIAAEVHAKKSVRQYAVSEVFRDPRVLALAAVYLLAITGALANIYWLPTFVKRISGLSIAVVTSLIMIPAFIGFAGTLINGWHSDKTSERRWHAAVPLLVAGFLYGCSILCRQDIPLALTCLLLGSGILYSFYPAFWSLPTLILSEAAAAASFGLIVSVAQLGGIAGPYMIGFLNDYTHSLAAGLWFIAASYVAAACLILLLKIEQPECAAQTRGEVELS
jgi:MFS transporter, ACS family, tartrate transporter